MELLPTTSGTELPAAASLRGMVFRACFAAVVGAALATSVVALWPVPLYETEVIGFAAWAHQSPALPTVYYLVLVGAGLLTFGLEPRLRARQARYVRWRLGAAAELEPASGARSRLPWLWLVGAVALFWKPAYAPALVAAGSLAWLCCIEIERAAADSARWRRARIGLAMATIGYGVGVAVLDLAPGRTRGLLNWYNPLMLAGSVALIVAVWWLWGSKRSQATPGRDGFVRAAWWLLPLGSLPLWGIVRNTLYSPWGSGVAGPAHLMAILYTVAALGTIGFCAVAMQGLIRLSLAENPSSAPVLDMDAAAEVSTEALLSRLLWLIWPVILFALVYERNLRLLDFSAKGIPFDFMHWGEWWSPWWDLAHDPARRLWVDVFPIHGYGCDVLPCSLAAWCGDATLSGRFPVTAFLNAGAFVAFFACMVAITRRRSVALLAVLVILWEEPSWYKVWLSDHRFLPLYLWVLAALGVGRALSGTGSTGANAAPPRRRCGLALLVGAAVALGVLPLVCLLTSVDVGYVALAATGMAAMVLVVWPKRWAAEPAQARLAGWVVGAALLFSCGLFLAWLGDRRESFLAYHWAVIRAKGMFDFLPLEFADELNLVKGIYVFVPPVVAVLAGLVALKLGAGARNDRNLAKADSADTLASAAAAPDTPVKPLWAFGPLAVAVIAALYFKKGLDRADSAHFEQAAVLTPILLAYLLTALEASVRWFGVSGASAPRALGAMGVLVWGSLLVWLGMQQGLASMASHPALNEMWGAQAVTPESNLPLAHEQVGTLRCSSERVLPINETLKYMDAHTAPQDMIYDFSNSGLWPFLAQRGNAARYAQTFHAMSREMQELVIADLAVRKPVLVLFPDQLDAVDFVDLALRQHWIAAWLLKHYYPAAHVGYYVMLQPVDPTWRSRVEPLVELPGVHEQMQPAQKFDPTQFIWQQDHGFLARAFGAEAAVSGETLVAEVSPATVALPIASARDLEALTKDLRQSWLFSATGAAPVVHIPLPKPLRSADADWLEVEFAVSGGTGGALAFDTEPGDGLGTLQQWWRRVLFKIEPVKRAEKSRRYRFHLAAMPDWMFQTAPVKAIDLQPTDTAGTTFEVIRIRFWKDAQR